MTGGIPRPSGRKSSEITPPGLKASNNAIPAKKDGSTSGSTTATRQKRGNGMSVRTTIHASSVPKSVVAEVTEIARYIVLSRGLRVCEEKSALMALLPSVIFRTIM